MKKHYHPVEALAALYKRKEHPDAVLYMRSISPVAENKIQKETLFLSDVAEWKRMDISCVKARVLGTAATYRQLLHHFAVPDILKDVIRENTSKYMQRSNSLGFELMKNSHDSKILNQLRLMDARVVLSRLSDRGSIETRTIRLSVFLQENDSIDLRPDEIPSHIIIPDMEK